MWSKTSLVQQKVAAIDWPSDEPAELYADMLDRDEANRGEEKHE